jgi:hypothetical protein
MKGPEGQNFVQLYSPTRYAEAAHTSPITSASYRATRCPPQPILIFGPTSARTEPTSALSICNNKCQHSANLHGCPSSNNSSCTGTDDGRGSCAGKVTSSGGDVFVEVAAAEELVDGCCNTR